MDGAPPPPRCQPTATRHPLSVAQSATAPAPAPRCASPLLRCPFGSTELDGAESFYGALRAGSHWKKVCHSAAQSERAQGRRSGCDWGARRLAPPRPPPRAVRRRGRWGRA